MKTKPKNKVAELKEKYAKKKPVKSKCAKKSVKKKVVSKKTKKDRPLTQKQEKFCIFYVEIGDASKAYRLAYSCDKMKDTTINRSAFELMQNHKITARIEELNKPIRKKMEITAEYVLGNIKEIGERCMQHKPVMYFDKINKEYIQETVAVKHEDGTITQEGVWEFKEAGALKAQELLGKNLKIFTEKVEEKVVERTKYITKEEETEIKKHIRESIK